MKYSLRTFQLKEWADLAKSLNSAFDLFITTGTQWTFPLTKAQLEEYLLNNPKRKQFWALKDDQVYGFGELVFEGGEVPRLSRLLILKSNERSKGLGKQLIKDLIEVAKQECNPECIYLYVMTENERAKKCYIGLGFVELPEKSTKAIFEGKEFPIDCMVLNLY